MFVPKRGNSEIINLPKTWKLTLLLCQKGSGEFDSFCRWEIIPRSSHENDMGFDLTVDETLLKQMEEAALPHYPVLSKATSRSERVGIRAYTSDFSPFFGQVPDLTGVYAASGLGSSGLTTGPIIGYHLAQLIQDKELTLDPLNYPIWELCQTSKKRIKNFTEILAFPLGW